MALESKIFKVKKSIIPESVKTFAALDRGCSCTKCLYVKKDFPSENIDGEEYHIFQLELWSNKDFELAIDQIRDNALLPTSGVMPVSGIGCDTYKKMIEEKINLRVQFQDEFKSHVQGIMLCKKHLDEGVYSEVVSERLQIKSIIKTASILEDRLKAMDSLFHVKTEFPTLFMVMGSATLFHKINEDGSAETLSTSFLGGLTFMSLAKLLLGVSDYEEVIRLAEAGERKNVDTLVKDLIDTSKEDNPYGVWNPDYPIMFFGKCASSDKPISEYKKEDVARSLVAASVSVAVTIIGHLAKAEGIKDILVGGSMAKSKLVRMEMIDAVKRDSFGKEYLNFRFMKFAHTSALGSILRANPDNPSYYI